MVVRRGRADTCTRCAVIAVDRPDRHLVGLRNRMSSPGVLLKLPVPSIRKPPGSGPSEVMRRHRAGAVGLPDRDVAGVVLEQDVGAAVAVEVAEPGAVVVERGGGEQLGADAGRRRVGRARPEVLPGDHDIGAAGRDGGMNWDCR